MKRQKEAKIKGYNIRLTNDDVNGHIKEMTEIFQPLFLLGCKVEDEEKVCLLLSSLPKQYDILVTAFGAADKAPSFQQVTERLLADVTRSSHARPVHQHEEAMKVRSKGGKTTLKCFHCHKEGHFKNSCPLLRQQNKKKTQTQSKLSSFLVEERCLRGEDCLLLTDNEWILDYGATSHMCNDIRLFCEFQRTDSVSITSGDGHKINSLGIGKVRLDLEGEKCTVNDVVCVPGLTHNLISVAKVLKHGGKCNFFLKSGKIIDGIRILSYVNFNHADNQFIVKCVPVKCLAQYGSVLSAENKGKHDLIGDGCLSGSKEDLWHSRFGHLGTDYLRKLSQKEMVSNFHFDHKKKINFCEFCTMGKHHRSPFPTHSDDQGLNDVLGLIHSDVCSPLPNSFVTFIDDCTRHCWVYTIQSKDQVFSVFKEFKTMVEKVTGKSVKILRSDNGGEHKSRQFKEFTSECGIRHEFTVPKTPEQNGVAERLNRVLIEKVRTMLVQSRLPHSFWAEALNTAVHVHNLSPSRVLGDKTPRELFTGKKPNVAYLRSFGCTAFVHVP